MIGPPLLMACLLFILYLNISVTLCTRGRRISCHLWKTICPWILTQILQLFDQGLYCSAIPVASHQLTVWPVNFPSPSSSLSRNFVQEYVDCAKLKEALTPMLILLMKMITMMGITASSQSRSDRRLCHHCGPTTECLPPKAVIVIIIIFTIIIVINIKHQTYN